MLLDPLVALQELYVHERHDQVHRYQQHGGGGPLSQVKLLEDLVVDAQSGDLGAPARATARQGKHHVKGVEVSIETITRLIKSMGASRGSITRVNLCQTLAPSTLAASITSSGRVCSPAYKRIMLKAVPRQMFATVTEASATCGSERKGTEGPIEPRT